MPTPENNIKDWLLPILEEKGISIEALARAAGLSRASLYHYLTDTRRPTTDAMRAICHALNLDPEEGMRQFTGKPIGRPKGAV